MVWQIRPVPGIDYLSSATGCPMKFVRRQKLFVNSQIQGSLLRKFFAFWVIYHGLLWMFMFVVYAVQEQATVSVTTSFDEFVQSQMLLPIAAFAILPIVAWNVVLLTHRIAGPLHQLNSRLKEMAAGAPAREISFRSDDMLTETEAAFNAYVRTLEVADKAETPQAAELPADPNLTHPTEDSEKTDAYWDRTDGEPVTAIEATVAGIPIELFKDACSMRVTSSNNKPHVRRAKHAGCRRPSGAALVEFALVAPIFFFIVLAMVEFGRMIMVQQILTNASREGARRAIVEGATPTEVEAVVKNYLQRSSVKEGTVTITPKRLDRAGFGDSVSVTVVVPFDAISWTGTPWLLRGKTLKAQTTMQAERLQ